MPIELFISYRRSDAAGHAGRLHDRLVDYFNREQIFYDLDTIEWGDRFPDRITNGVRECKVLLAVMAPDWLTVTDDSGRRRLDDEKDFVRCELALALAEGKKVFVVALGGARIPTTADLPAPLAGLTACDVAELGGKSFEYDAQIERLVALVGKALGVKVSRRPKAAGGQVDARKLAVLCDRSQQDAEVRDTVRAQMRAVQATRRPFVIVLHGPANEAHDAFVERLEGFSLPRLLADGRWGAPVDFLPAFEPLPCNAGQEKFDLRLREAMARALKLPTMDSDAEMVAEVRASKLGAAVAVFGWSASEIPCAPGVALELVHRYWSRFPDIPAQTLIGCVVWFKYDARAAGGRWLKQLFGGGGDKAGALRAAIEGSAAAHGNDPLVVWRVLPELPSVTVDDLSRWVREVGDLIGGGFHVPRERLHAIVGEAAPMDDVLPQLEKLVPQG